MFKFFNLPPRPGSGKSTNNCDIFDKYLVMLLCSVLLANCEFMVLLSFYFLAFLVQTKWLLPGVFVRSEGPWNSLWFKEQMLHGSLGLGNAGVRMAGAFERSWHAARVSLDDSRCLLVLGSSFVEMVKNRASLWDCENLCLLLLLCRMWTYE